MSTWLIYLWTRLDSIYYLLITLVILGSIATVPMILIGLSDNDEMFKKLGIKFAVGTLIAAILSVAIPTKKDAAIIYVTPKLVNSKFVQDDCPEIAKLGIEALKQQLLEFTKGAKNENTNN